LENRPKVLYVDDEETNLIVFRANFESKYPLLTAKSGQAALEILQTEDIAVLIADQRMPGMTGNDLMEIAKERAPDTVRVIVTAFSDLKPVLEAVHRGQLFHYVVKPWTAPEMTAIIEGAYAIHNLAMERKKMQASLVASERLATLGMMAGNIAHEMRNSITAPIANVAILDLILPKFLDLAERLEKLRSSGFMLPVELLALVDSVNYAEEANELRETWADVKKSLSLTHNLSESLLGMMRQGEMKLEAIDTGVFIQVVGRLAKDFTAAYHAQVQIFPGNVPAAKADAVALRRILINLIANAAQASRPGTSWSDVELRASFDDDWVYIEVRDKGVGIAPDQMENLFKPLYTTKPEGTGLGLSMCRDLAHSMGGEILVESKVGEGSVFSVRLPIWR
jgi:two-component system, sensor histidine kinase and response regulator